MPQLDCTCMLAMEFCMGVCSFNKVGMSKEVFCVHLHIFPTLTPLNKISWIQPCCGVAYLRCSIRTLLDATSSHTVKD